MGEVKHEALFTREAGQLKGFAIETEDHTIYYETAANSDDVEKTFILAHGAFASGRYMNLVAHEILEQIPNSKVLVLDLPYHGYSTASIPVEGVTVHGYKEAVADALTQLDEVGELVGTKHWIGWSMGGSIGLLLSIEDNAFEELTVLNSSPVWETVDAFVSAGVFSDTSTAKAISKNILFADLEGEEQVILDAIEANFDDMTAVGNVIKNDFESITTVNYDVRDKLSEVKAKTLIFSGVNDGVALEPLQHEMAEKIPNNTLVLVDDNHTTVLKPNRAKVIAKHIKDVF